jgi:phosphatidate phosphatase APP1
MCRVHDGRLLCTAGRNMRRQDWRPTPGLDRLHAMRARSGRVAAAGVGLTTAGALAWLVRTRTAVMRAVLIRLAMVLEDVVRLVQVGALRLFRRSTEPLLIPFVGHGSPQRVELGARAVLGRPDARARVLPVPDDGVLAPVRGPGRAPARRSRRSVLRTSLSRFLTVEVADATVTARTPDAVVTVRSDRDGYVDAVVTEPGLAPGWHDIELSLAGGATVRTPVLVVAPDVRLGLVSDVDDTILETGLTRGLEFLRITLLTEVTDRAPLPGAAALYRALVCRSGEAGLPVFYLSTSPWNLHEVLQEFIALRGFPFGPLLLTDWGPGRGNLFRIGAREHKLGLIRRILAEHPDMQLLLVGDTGQLDPEIYAAAAREHPGRIRAIYVRRTGVLNLRRAAEVDALAAETTAAGVPMLAVDDSVEIAEHAASLGFLDAAQVEEVRRETHPNGGSRLPWPMDVRRARQRASDRASST